MEILTKITALCAKGPFGKIKKILSKGKTQNDHLCKEAFDNIYGNLIPYMESCNNLKN
jgi:hypothetical protein